MTLPEDAAHRFLRVLRLAEGTTVELFDGTGRVARGALESPNLLSDVVLSQAAALLPPLVVVQGVTKTDKLELVVQKGTELGASAIWLLACARSQVHLDDDRAAKRCARLSRVADDAARQCGRAVVPAVEGPLALDALAQRIRDFAGVAVVGMVDAHASMSEALEAADARVASAGVLVVVGPEGGLDAREAQVLVEAGAVAVRLGAHVLRTETAGLVALAAAQVALGHL